MRKVKPKHIKRARKTMRSAFEQDPHFRETYVQNIAMLLHDFYEDADLTFSLPEKREQIADDIIEKIFY